ncbi:hypothetical protein HGRIS_003936 [Hohenbuehelia grisea]|uniref:Uncharacterized protein n=1 Tax=Hohenbuehelia grisea TaxID=104357 RepID=A0ABR3JIN9_9AGAR
MRAAILSLVFLVLVASAFPVQQFGREKVARSARKTTDIPSFSPSEPPVTGEELEAPSLPLAQNGETFPDPNYDDLSPSITIDPSIYIPRPTATSPDFIVPSLVIPTITASLIALPSKIPLPSGDFGTDTIAQKEIIGSLTQKVVNVTHKVDDLLNVVHKLRDTLPIKITI